MFHSIYRMLNIIGLSLVLVSGAVAQNQAPVANPPVDAPQAPAPAPQQTVLKPETIVARVNGQEITGQQVIESVQSLAPQLQAQVNTLYPQLLQRVVSLKLIADKAKMEKTSDDPEYKALLKKYEEEILREVFLRKYVMANLNDQMIKDRYDDNLKKNPPQEEIRASHILLKTEKEATDVIAQLKKGEAFAKLANDKSIDRGNAEKGGDLGYFNAQGVVKEFGDAAFAMKPGQVSEKPVKSQFGWHVIQVVERRTATPPSFEEQMERIRAVLAEEQVQKLVAELSKDAKIELFGPDGSPLKK